MKIVALAVSFLLSCGSIQADDHSAATVIKEGSYDNWFTCETMRVDLFHTGDKDSEEYSLDEVVLEGPWPGTRTKLIDTLNRGQYMLSVYDVAEGTLIYSRGFSTLFNEWQTTEEAAKLRKTLSESVRFPKPKKPVYVAISVRDKKNVFQEIYRIEVDPDNHNVKREKRFAGLKVLDLHVPAEPHRTYDILILPDGYTEQEIEKLRSDARRVATNFLTTKPYDEMKDIVSFRALEVISRESGPDEPRKGIWRDTAFGASFNTFDSARYMMTTVNKEMREIAANAPYDALLIMVNTSRYGGGGIYNLYCTFAVDNEFSGYLVRHETGHSFGGLGDEYYTSQVSYTDFYPQGVEPWEPNITALLDPKHIKWGAFIAEGTPIPTPAEEQYRNVVGAFEGAGYVAKGLYRPSLDCLMFSKREMDFDPVCLAAMKELLLFYTED